MSKLHYIAVNEHTKYEPIRCELDDGDKYRVKPPIMTIVSFIGIFLQSGVGLLGL